MTITVYDIKHLGVKYEKKGITVFYTNLFGSKYNIKTSAAFHICAKAQIFFSAVLLKSVIFTEVIMISAGPI